MRPSLQIEMDGLINYIVYLFLNGVWVRRTKNNVFSAVLTFGLYASMIRKFSKFE